MFKEQKNKKQALKALVVVLELLAMGLVVYLIIMPIWPALQYGYFHENQADAQDLKKVASQTAQLINHLPLAKKNVFLNRLIIAKIGVNAPIVESKDAAAGLNQGAWRVPESSTPDKGGNTVITGHRFKYLPPNNLTFYLLDKLEINDLIALRWQGKAYYYRVKETKIVPPTEVSILEPTVKPTLTLYTCDPIFSETNRLVVVAELLPD